MFTPSLRHTSARHLLLLCGAALLTTATGCATAADMGASMLGPNAVEKVQHKRQVKELDAVKKAKDVSRARQMCDGGQDKDAIALKRDVRADACGTYAQWVAAEVPTMSCAAFDEASPSFLRYTETEALTRVANEKTGQCREERAAQAQEQKEAEEAERARRVRQQLDGSTAEELAQTCRTGKTADGQQIERDEAKTACTMLEEREIARLSASGCKAYVADASTILSYKVSTLTSPTIKTAAARAVACEDWSGFVSQVLFLSNSYDTRREALEAAVASNGKSLDEVMATLGSAKGPFKQMQDDEISHVSYLLSSWHKDKNSGTCKEFKEVLGRVKGSGRGAWLELMKARQCEGAREIAEQTLLDDDANARASACEYLGEYGDKGSIKKMQTISYTDPVYNSRTGEYYVRSACRQGYGKLMLKYDN